MKSETSAFRLALAIVIVLGSSVPAHAGIYNWNTTSGTWDTTSANWSGAGTTWVNANDAVFSNNTTTSAYDITLSGTINAASISVGSNSAAAAKDNSYNLSGGTLNVTGAFVVQGKSNNGGTYTNNTTVTVDSTVGVTGDTRIGRSNLTISGGTYTTNRITTNPASTDWANLTISGAGTVVTATNGIDGTYGTTGSNGSTATFAVNLNGGTLYTPYFKVADRESSGVAVMTFNGTTVKATASTETFITLYGGNQNSYISNGGAILDTNGNNITIGVNLKNTSGQTGTLTKQGTGTLTLSGTNSYTGQTTISGGTLKVSGGSLASPTLNVGTSTYSQTAGTTNFTSSISTSGSADGALISVTGGSFSASSLSLGRTQAYTTAPTLASPIAAATTSGLNVNGASAVNMGSLNIGTANSSASARIDDGSVTVSGAVTIGKYSSSSTRHSILQVNGGTFSVADTTAGIVLAPNGGSNNRTGAAEFYLSGGTSTVGRIGFGVAADTVGGSGFLILGGGNLYVGSGGIVKATTIGAYTATIGLNSGTLGAADNWSSSLDMTLGANPTIKAADASDTAKDITLGGVLSGTGFTKTGGGTLTLEGNNTYTGTTTVSAGTLKIDGGSIASSDVTVDGGVLASGTTGTVGKTVAIHNGAKLAAGGIGAVGAATVANDLNFSSGSIFDWDLTTGPGNGTYDTVSVAGTLNITSGAKFNVVSSTTFSDPFWDTAHTWSNIFGAESIDHFLTANFLYSGSATAPSTEGYFTVSGSNLTWTAVPEPTSTLAGLLLTAGLLRRRR